MRHLTFTFALASLVLFGVETANAGPIIVDGTDANDHGFFSGTNQAGWEYMQRALENIGPAVTNGQNRVVTFGVNGGNALAAINSAFNLSTLPGAGWTMQHITGAANITSFLTGGTVGSANLANTGIIHLTTAGSQTSGDMTAAELAAINANAAVLNTFVGGGGGFWSMTEDGSVGAYLWLQSLIPGITFVSGGSGSAITLTVQGSAAFPGLTNADLAGATPWHTDFGGNFGGLVVLGQADRGGVQRPVILGGGGGGAFNPPGGVAAPEPGTFVLFGMVLAIGVGCYFFRRQRTVASAV